MFASILQSLHLLNMEELRQLNRRTGDLIRGKPRPVFAKDGHVMHRGKRFRVVCLHPDAVEILTEQGVKTISTSQCRPV